MRCPTCDRVYPPDSRFCPADGSLLEPAPDPGPGAGGASDPLTTVRPAASPAMLRPRAAAGSRSPLPPPSAPVAPEWRFGRNEETTRLGSPRVRSVVIGVGVVAVGLLALGAGTLLAVNGRAETNTARWLEAQLAAVPGSVSYDRVSTHPLAGHISLWAVRYTANSESAPLTDADAEAVAERVDLDVPRSFFVLAALDRLPPAAPEGRITTLHAAAHTVRTLRDGRTTGSAEDARIDFDGDVVAGPVQNGQAALVDLLATDQRVRVEASGVDGTLRLASMLPGGVATGLTRLYDAVVYDVAYDARQRRVRVVEASARRDGVSLRASGGAVLTPAFVAGDERGLLVESAEAEFDATSSSPLSLPLPDGSRLEIGEASLRTRGPLHMTFVTDIGTARAVPGRFDGRISGSAKGIRLLLSPAAARAFDDQLGQALGLTAASLGEPTSFSGDAEYRDGRLTLHEADVRMAVGRARASGVLRLDPVHPEAAFFEQPLQLSFTDLDATLEASLSRVGAALAQRMGSAPPTHERGGLTMQFGGAVSQY